MKRKAIYLDANADLATALSKLSRVEASEIILVIPRGSVLFHSAVNLKILKSDVESSGKSLALVTMDIKGKAIAARVGIPVYQDLNLEDSKIPATEHTVVVKPISDSRLIKVKYKRKLPKSQPIEKVENIIEKEPSESEPSSKVVRSSFSWDKNGLVVVFIILALLVLGGVVCFVLPKATVYLDIYSEQFTHRFKLVLADRNDLNAAGQNLFKGRFIEVIKEVVQTFPATGVKNRGNQASGIITVYNYTKSFKKGLIPNTRFVSDDGLVFRTKEEIWIALAQVGRDGTLIPGRAKVKVIADEGGNEGNLPAGVKLTIPGLIDMGVSGDLVYGESDTPFSGGTDDKVKIVSEEDIESARESVSRNVFLDTEALLQTQVGKEEELIMPLIQNDIIDSIPSVAAGVQREAFDLKVQVRSWTLLPDKDRLENIIDNTISAIVPRDQELTPQTLKGARIVMDNANFLLHILDFTVELDGLIAVKMDLAEMVGSIANRTPSSVEKLLDGIPDVASNKIVLWPFWVKRLPILESNIKIIPSYIGQ